MEYQELNSLEERIMIMHENFHNGLVFDGLVEVRNLSLGDGNRYTVNEKIFILPTNRVLIDVTEIINNKNSIDNKADKLFLSLVSYIRNEINQLIDNHKLQSTLKDFKQSIKLLLSGEIVIDKEEDGSYTLSTRIGCGMIH